MTATDAKWCPGAGVWGHETLASLAALCGACGHKRTASAEGTPHQRRFRRRPQLPSPAWPTRTQFPTRGRLSYGGDAPVSKRKTSMSARPWMTNQSTSMSARRARPSRSTSSARTSTTSSLSSSRSSNGRTRRGLRDLGATGIRVEVSPQGRPRLSAVALGKLAETADSSPMGWGFESLQRYQLGVYGLVRNRAEAEPWRWWRGSCPPTPAATRGPVPPQIGPAKADQP